jgi:hypothetical protein
VFPNVVRIVVLPGRRSVEPGCPSAPSLPRDSFLIEVERDEMPGPSRENHPR